MGTTVATPRLYNFSEITISLLSLLSPGVIGPRHIRYVHLTREHLLNKMLLDMRGLTAQVMVLADRQDSNLLSLSRRQVMVFLFM